MSITSYAVNAAILVVRGGVARRTRYRFLSLNAARRTFANQFNGQSNSKKLSAAESKQLVKNRALKTREPYIVFFASMLLDIRDYVK